MSLPPYSTISLRTTSCILYIHYIHWFDLFAPKTMSPPPYTTIPLHTASTVYCIHCILCPLHTASTVYCIHCVHCMPYMVYVSNLFVLTKCPPHPPTLLVTHETIMNQKLLISNQYPSTNQKMPKTYTFFAAWPI